MAEHDDDRDLGTQLFQVENHTLEDGRVRGRIVDVDDSDGSIDLEIRVLTTRDTFTESFEKPRSWTRKNRFVRLVEWLGYNSASALHIDGDEIPLAEDGDGWKIDTERLPGDNVAEQRDYYRGVFRGAFAISVLVAAIVWYGGLLTQIGLNKEPAFVVYIGMILLTIYALARFIYQPVDDDKETLSVGEMQPEDVDYLKCSTPTKDKIDELNELSKKEPMIQGLYLPDDFEPIEVEYSDNSYKLIGTDHGLVLEETGEDSG